MAGGMMGYVPTTMTTPTAEPTVHAPARVELWLATQPTPAPERRMYVGRHRRPDETAEASR